MPCKRNWKKVTFLAWIKRNAERRRSICNWIRKDFFNFSEFCSTFEAARAGFREPDRQKWGIYPCFCLLSVPCDPVSEILVDKNQIFPLFLSTFGPVRPGFREHGRQKWDIYPCFCLLSVPHNPVSKCQVDKNEAFTPVFVYFRFRVPQFSESMVDKNEAFTPVFVYFRSRATRFQRAW